MAVSALAPRLSATRLFSATSAAFIFARAARAYDHAAREHFGEFAAVNFPEHAGERCCLAPTDPDLMLINEAWVRLPEAMRAGILAMVRASSGG